MYDDKMAFVSQYGKDVIGLLQPQPGEQIIDLGGGTGDLTFEISRSGAEVTCRKYFFQTLTGPAKERLYELIAAEARNELFKNG